MFNVDVNKAQIIVLEAALPFAWLRRGLGWSSIKPLGLEHPIDAVAIEVWQEVPEHEGEIIQGEACRPAHSADNGVLLLVHEPSQALGDRNGVVWGQSVVVGVAWWGSGVL